MEVELRAGARIDMLSRPELREELAQLPDDVWKRLARGVKQLRLPVLQAVPAGSVLLPAVGDPTICGPREGFVWSVRRITAAGLTGIAGEASATTVGTTGVAPGAGTTITSQALGAGTYSVSWTAQLSGTVAAGDANNFGLYVGAALVATALNPAAVGTYPQPPVAVVIPPGGATLAVKNIGAGTAAAVYSAQLTTTDQPDILSVYKNNVAAANLIDVLTAVKPAIYAGKLAITLFPGESLVCQGFGLNSGLVTVSGEATEVAAEEVFKLL